jgi:myo-inositol 2-dehydrogenase / D-chiro-inositol 1-dehydrogenase
MGPSGEVGGSGTVAAPLRVGVVGTGRIGRMHAELLATRVPGAADADRASAEAVASAHRVPCLDTDSLIAGPEVEAVAICSSTPTHVDLIVAACEAGKPVFCEKPISLHLADVDRALSAVERAGVPFMIGFNRRFDPAHRAVHESVARGEVGEPHLVKITSRDPELPPFSYLAECGGIFLDSTIHDFDMARYMTGSEVVEVYARGAVRIEPRLVELGDVDTVVVTLVHASGCLTVIDNSLRALYGYDQRVEVFGSKGMAASDNPLTSTSMVRTAEGTRQPVLPYFFVERYVASYVNEWCSFAEAVRSGTPCPVGAADGRATLVVGLAAGLSLKEHRPVDTAEIDTHDSGGRGVTPASCQASPEAPAEPQKPVPPNA